MCISCSVVDIATTEAFKYFCFYCVIVTDISALYTCPRAPLNLGPIKLFPSNNLETAGSEFLNSGAAKDSSHLGCYALLVGKELQTFQRQHDLLKHRHLLIDMV
jgi:hypothetical protein